MTAHPTSHSAPATNTAPSAKPKTASKAIRINASRKAWRSRKRQAAARLVSRETSGT
jgi:hypothetical protein